MELPRKLILVVDDQPVVADTLALVLKSYGYLSIPCYSAEGTITIFGGLKPDVLVCDVVLRNASGIEVALNAKRLCQECTVILISGNDATTEMIEKAKLDLAEIPLLGKPFNPRELIEVIESTSNRRRGASGRS